MLHYYAGAPLHSSVLLPIPTARVLHDLYSDGGFSTSLWGISCMPMACLDDNDDGDYMVVQISVCSTKHGSANPQHQRTTIRYIRLINCLQNTRVIFLAHMICQLHSSNQYIRSKAGVKIRTIGYYRSQNVRSDSLKLILPVK